MMNVLLVEDEWLVRSGMKALVDWKAEDFELVADVSHGGEALKILERHSIDIVLTDIRMPVVDGLQLIEAIRENNYPCEVIVLSSYDDFQYVRQAMQLGVRDYIHKPTITPDELMNTLKKVRQDILKRQDLERYRRMIVETAEESRELVIQKVLQQALDGSSIPLDSSVRNILEDHFILAVPFYLILVAFSEVDDKMIEKEVVSEENILTEALQSFRKEDDVVYIKKDDYWVILTPTFGSQWVCCLKQWTNERVDCECVVSETPCELRHLAEVHETLRKKLSEQLSLNRVKQKQHPIIRQALQYIHEHYADALTLQRVASHVHVNSSYLSRLFYKELGETFIDYVTKYRMERAASWLIKTDSRIYEIAKRVGYTDSKHFLKVFKRMYRMTPGEYRQKKTPIR